MTPPTPRTPAHLCTNVALIAATLRAGGGAWHPDRKSALCLNTAYDCSWAWGTNISAKYLRGEIVQLIPMPRFDLLCTHWYDTDRKPGSLYATILLIAIAVVIRNRCNLESRPRSELCDISKLGIMSLVTLPQTRIASHLARLL